MRKIAIISASVREGRLSHRIALYLNQYIRDVSQWDTEILDLKEYGFVLFHERYVYLKDPEQKITDYVERFRACDGIVVVSPVYNASFPASLKNVIDLLTEDWKHKPVCVVSVTSGQVPGIATVQELQALLLKMGARVAAPVYTVIKAGEDFTEEGVAVSETSRIFAEPTIRELMWLVEKSSAEQTE